MIRSTSDDANMPVIAAVELSGPPIANGNELPNASTSGDHRRRDEGHRDAIGEIGRQRTGEDQQRIGQAEGDGQDAGGAAAENIIERGAQF